MPGGKSPGVPLCEVCANIGRLLRVPMFQLEIAAILAFVLYSASLVNGFTYDDYLVIVNNPLLYKPGILPGLFSQHYFEFSGEASYRPVITFVYWLGTLVSGHNPMGFHLLNLVFHTLAAVAVTRLAQILGLRVCALWVGAAFAIHPLLSEAVCSVGFGEDLLVTLFVVTSLLGVIFFERQEGRAGMLCGMLFSIGSFVLALFSKESGVALIPILAALSWVAPDLNLQRRKLLYGLAILIPVSIFYLWIRFIVLPGTAIPAPPLSHDWTVVVATASHIVFSYFGRLIYPVTLSVDRVTEILSPGTWRFALSAVVHLMLIAGALVYRKRFPLFSLGVFWFYFAIAPVSNLIAMFCPEADRFLYLPAVGFFLAAGFALESLSNRSIAFARVVAAVALLLLGLWAGRTVIREGDWQDNYALWSSELRINPENVRAMAELAVEANYHGWHPEAERFARGALALDSRHALAQLQLGKSLLMQQRYGEALSAYQRLLKDGGLPIHQLSMAWFDMAFILERSAGNSEEAIKAYLNALAIDPNYLGASINLGRLYTNRGDFDAAAKVWRETLQRFPGNAEIEEYLRSAEKKLRCLP